MDIFYTVFSEKLLRIFQNSFLSLCHGLHSRNSFPFLLPHFEYLDLNFCYTVKHIEVQGHRLVSLFASVYVRYSLMMKCQTRIRILIYDTYHIRWPIYMVPSIFLGRGQFPSRITCFTNRWYIPDLSEVNTQECYNQVFRGGRLCSQATIKKFIRRNGGVLHQSKISTN